MTTRTPVPSSHLTANWVMSLLMDADAKVSGSVSRCADLSSCRCRYPCRYEEWEGVVESRHYRTGWIAMDPGAVPAGDGVREYRIILRDCPISKARITAESTADGKVTHVAMELLRDDQWCAVDCSYVDQDVLSRIVGAMLAGV